MNNPTMIELHPEILRKDGKAQYAIIAWDEYVRLQEYLQDTADLFELRKAKSEDDGTGRISFEALKHELEEHHD